MIFAGHIGIEIDLWVGRQYSFSFFGSSSPTWNFCYLPINDIKTISQKARLNQEKLSVASVLIENINTAAFSLLT